MADDRDVQLEQPPSDTVTSLSWSPTANYLIATSWAKDIRCWHVDRGHATIKKKKTAATPVFCSSWSQDGKSVFFGSADGKAFVWSLGHDKVTQVGQHQGPVAAIKPVPRQNLVATLGWDQTVKYWDSRARDPAHTLEIPDYGRGYVMEVSAKWVVVGAAVQKDKQRVDLISLDRAPDRVAKSYPSDLKRYMRSIVIFPDERACAAASIEGRVAVLHFNPRSGDRDTTFAFKCHRKGPKDEQVFPIHGLSCHPKKNGCFASCGGDGTLAYWDRKTQTRLKTLDGYYNRDFPKDVPITAVSFNSHGDLLAYTRGYDWAKGAIRSMPKVGVFLKRVSADRDLAPPAR